MIVQWQIDYENIKIKFITFSHSQPVQEKQEIKRFLKQIPMVSKAISVFIMFVCPLLILACEELEQCPFENCQQCANIQVCNIITKCDEQCIQVQDPNDCYCSNQCVLCEKNYASFEHGCSRPNCSDPNCKTCEENTTYCLLCYPGYKYQNTCYIQDATPCSDSKCASCDQRNLNCLQCQIGYGMSSKECALESLIVLFIISGSVGFILFIFLFSIALGKCRQKKGNAAAQADTSDIIGEGSFNYLESRGQNR